MLSNWKQPKKLEPELMDEKLKELRDLLATKQNAIKDSKKPIMVIVEGWGAW